MTDLRYLAPTTLDEAIGAYAAAGSAARILAGGTDLLVQMRSGSVKPDVIVDIKKIAEMTKIEETTDGGFRIGAAVSGAVLAEHSRFGRVWPGVLEAVNLIGSKQVQGRASAGGNLCNGSPAGDSVPAMVAAGAVVTLQGPNGRRELPVEQVPAGPGRLNLLPGEILVCFTLPPRPSGSSDAYLRMIPRTEMDIAVVGVGVSLTLKDGVCIAARVGLGAVAPTVLLVEAAAKALIGSPLDDAALNAAAAACSAACRPIDDKRGTIAYRTRIAGVLLKRTTAIAAKRAEGNL
jgi:carbon-monoxide dehydrogenase medium subunit